MRRLQVENVNSTVKADGGLDPKMCRARGLGAHTLAALAAAIAHNLKLAKSDPYADNAHDSEDHNNGESHNGRDIDTGEHDSNPSLDVADTDTPPSTTAGDDSDNHCLRAPP